MRTTYYLLIFPLLILFTIVSTAFSQDIEHLGTTVFWGESDGVQVYNEIAWIRQNEVGIRLVDISDHTNPTELPNLFSNFNITSFAFKDSLVFLSTDDYDHNFLIYNISDIHNPNLVGYNDDIYDNANEILIDSNLAFISYNSFVTIVDFSDLSDPIILSTQNLDRSIRNIQFYNDSILLVSCSSTLYSFDYSNPSVPIVEVITDEWYSNFLMVNNNYGYNVDNQTLHILDFANLENITELGSCLVGLPHSYIEPTGRICINGENAFVISKIPDSENYFQLKTVNISDPSNPTVINEYPLSYTNAVTGATIDENIYLASYENEGIKLFDLSNPVDPEEICNFGKRVNILSMLINDNVAYAISDAYEKNHERSQYPRDFLIIDVTDPFNYAIIDTFQIQSLHNQVKLVNGDLYLFNSDTAGIDIYSIADPFNPVFERTICDNITITAVEERNGFLFYQDSQSLKIAHVDTPENHLSIIESGSQNFALDGNLLAISTSTDIDIYEISNLESPVLISEIPFDIHAYELTMENQLLAYNSLYEGEYNEATVIKFYNLENPVSPVQISSIDFGAGYNLQTDLKDNYLYVSGQSRVLKIYNLTNPVNPVLDYMYGFDNHPYSGSFFFGSRKVFYTSRNFIETFDCSSILAVEGENSTLANGFKILKTYPNPFNPTLNISIELPWSAQVNLAVYNINGQLVEKLLNENFVSGQHNLTFDGSELSSGVYFLKMVIPGKYNQTQKILLLK